MKIRQFAIYFLLVSVVLMLINVNHTETFAESETILVGFHQNTPPFQFIDRQGKPAGMHIDILNRIAQLRNLEIEYIPFNNTIDAMKEFQEGKFHILLGIEKPKLNSNDAQATINLSSVSLCLIAPNSIKNEIKDMEEYRRYRAVFETGTISNYMLSSIPVKYFIIAGNQISLLEYQVSGKADLIIGTMESMLYLLNQEGLEKEYSIIQKHLGHFSYVMKVQNTQKELLRILEYEIANMQATGIYEQIYNNWIIKEEDHDENLRKVVRQLLLATCIIIVLAAVYILFSIRIRKLLRRQVERKTLEVQRANKELERRIQQVQSESELRNNIIRCSPNGMVLFDRDFNIKLINRVACYLAGVNESAVGESVMELGIFGDILKSIRENIFNPDFVMNSRTIIMENEEGIKNSYRYSIQQIQEYGNVSGALMTVEDITKEENEKKELFEKEKSKMLNRIVSGIAHEIKNPLTSIRTFVSLDPEKFNSPRFINFYKKYIPSEVERINKLIENLINYAKPGIGKKTVTDISQIIHECVFFINSTIDKENIIVQEYIDENIKIYADKDQIRQVFINIIMNGIESMEEKLSCQDTDGLVLKMKISTRVNEKYVEISVRDEGMGIPDDILERCMEPFFTTKEHGSGMGLALSRHYVEENNGEMSIETSVGMYTDIRIKFRRYYDEA